MVNSPKNKNKPKTSFWLRIIGTTLSAILFIWLLSNQSWQEIMLYLSQLPIWLIPLSLCLYVTGLCLNAVRWKVLLVPTKIKISFNDVTKMVFSGVYASNFLPTTVGGDAVRFISMLRFSPDRVLCFTSIAIDRVVNMAAFLTILPITLAVFGSPISLIKNLLTSSSKLIFLVPLVGKVDTNEDGEPVSLLSKLSKKILSGFTRGKISFTIWLKNPGYIVLAFAISWLSIFVIFVAIWLVATGLEMQVTLIEVMAVTLITYLITLLPISLNGLGIREILITGLYTHLGASSEQAAILAVITRFLSMVATLPGFLWISEVSDVIQKESPLE